MHRCDFRGLHLFNIVGKDADVDFLSGQWCRKQVFHHLDCSFVVLDHVDQKLPVKLGTLGIFEFFELGRRQHARHHHRRVRHGVGSRLPIVQQPVLHLHDFDPLRLIDFRGEKLQPGIGAVLVRQLRHGDGLRVVRDHALHEAHVRFRESCAGRNGDGCGHSRHLGMVYWRAVGLVDRLATGATGKQGEEEQCSGNAANRGYFHSWGRGTTFREGPDGLGIVWQNYAPARLNNTAVGASLFDNRRSLDKIVQFVDGTITETGSRGAILGPEWVSPKKVQRYKSAIFLSRA